jgi:3-hydroxyisobutyrate dehydrogenase
MATTLGWIGTGIMGRSMCGHLLAGGHGVQIYSRTRSKAEDLIVRGARWADSPAAAARGAEVVFTMVGLPSDVREVYFGESGIFGGLGPGTVLVDMTTTEPRLAVEIADSKRARTPRDGVDARCRAAMSAPATRRSRS